MIPMLDHSSRKPTTSGLTQKPKTDAVKVCSQSEISRRSALLTLGAAGATLASARPSVAAEPTAAAAKPERDAMVGVQMAPFNLLHEGIEHCLDLLQTNAEVNTLICYTHTYYGGSTDKPTRVLAPDHGVSVDDYFDRKMPDVWVKHRESYFKDSRLKHEPVQPDWKFADRDVFQEVAEPARKRGMKVYARFFDPKASNGKKIKNFDDAVAVDVFGQPGGGPCWNNPHYRQFVRATMQDMFDAYPLDGILWGVELGGPLSELLYWGREPYCFCKYCEEYASSVNLDLKRARQGYAELTKFVRTFKQNAKPPIDGVMTTIFHFLQKYPEILGWNYQFLMSAEHYRREINQAIHGSAPNAHIGRHIDNQITGWDLLQRSAIPYSVMAEADDFLRPSLYSHILGPRVRWFYLERMKHGALQELTIDQSLDLYYAMMGLDASRQPTAEELDHTGMNPEDYVTRETQRCVVGAGDQADVIPAIGFDVPKWGGDTEWAEMSTFRTPPEYVYRAVRAAYEGGADGVMAAREYDEMRLENLKAFGRAVRDSRQ